MDSTEDTEELRSEQLARELVEARLASDAPPEDPETAQHKRRAEKARYLREKLEERAEAEKEIEADADGEDPRSESQA